MTVSETFAAWRARSAGLRPGPRDAVGRRMLAGEPLKRLLFISFGLAGLAITLVIVAVANGPQISITDEPVHAGYLYDASHLQIPYKGEATPKEIRYEWYCHDLQASTGSAACSGYDNSSFHTDSQIYTFGDPPVYCAISARRGCSRR